MIVVKTLSAWLFADFLAGMYHWAQDRYMPVTSKSRLVRALALDNQVHHAKPTQMLIYSYVENIKYTAIVTLPLTVLLMGIQAPIWLTLAVFFATFSNLIHRFGHTPKRKLPRWIRGLQEFGLFISPEHHDIHHRHDGKLVTKCDAHHAYCPMTDWVNPVIDRLHVWETFEWMLARIGIEPIPECSHA